MTRRAATFGAAVLIVLAVAPDAGALRPADDRHGLAVFAADAEAWAFSVEVGSPWSIRPLSSHTKASIDNSPHATGAAGLADPGLPRPAVGDVMFGVSTPANCESAFPEGPPEADCAAPAGERGVEVGRAHTVSTDRPGATSTARYGRVLFNELVLPTVTIKHQSAIAATTATESGVEAHSGVVLQGVSLVGGAVRIESIKLARSARADGTERGLTTATVVILSGLSVAGETVDPGHDAVRALTDAARVAYGDQLQISAGDLVEERSAGGKLLGHTSGLVVRWRPSPERWARAVLGYVGVMAQGVPKGADTVLDSATRCALGA